MAKFNRRRTPPKVSFEHTIYYGYRGAFFVVNGTRYNSANGTVIANSEQTQPGYDLNLREDTSQASPVGSQVIGLLAVESCFEPGMIASNYDLLGSRWSSEYAQGTFLNYGTFRNGSGHCFFKNRIGYHESTLVVDGEGSATSGQKYGYDSYFIPPVTVPTENSRTFIARGLYIPVEGPANTYNLFNPFTFGLTQFNYNSGNQNFIRQNTIAEQVFGSTTNNFTNSHVGSVSWGNNQANRPHSYWATSGTTLSPNVLSGARVGIFDNNISADMADQHQYGGTYALTFIQISGVQATNRHLNIFGGYLYNNLTQGAQEAGVRTFLSRSTNQSFYFLYDASVGGHQGVDTGPASVSRLSLRNFNHGTQATTTRATFKKGVAGLVIPSHPDEDTSTNYRFYMISFNGADTATQTISIYRVRLDHNDGSLSSTSYTNTMTTNEQVGFYVDMGHNNTHVSVYNHAQFRRGTVYRIWYSVSETNVKRLHLGVYNTNATGFVTTGNGFTSLGGRGSMYKIYSWTLNDGTTTATYLGSINMHNYAPRYFCPLDGDWRNVYIGSAVGNDIVIALNDTTGLYQYVSTLPYNAARLFKDKDGRWSTQVVDLDVTVVASNGNISGNYIDVIAEDVANSVVITTDDSTFVYSGETINSNIRINVFDYQGNRVERSVTLNIIGSTSTPGVAFEDGTYTKVITTSDAADTLANVRIISAASAKIIGTVVEE